MNGNRGLWRIAGWLAVVHVVLMLGSFALQRVSPLGAGTATVVKDHVTWSMTKGFMGGYLTGVSFLVFLLLASLLGRLLRGGTEISGWLSSTIVASGSLYVAVTLAGVLPALGAALYDGHHGAPLSTVTAFDHMHWFAVFTATLVLGVFILTVSVAVWMTGVLSRWVSYSGFVAGVACLVAVPGARAGLVDDATLVWVVWFLGFAVAALRGPRPVPRQATSRPAAAS